MQSVEDLEAALRILDQQLEAQRKANPLRLIRHPREGIIPLRFWKRQREFFKAFRDCRKFAAWVGPNRPGKSTAAAAIVAGELLGWPVESWQSLPWDLSQMPMGPPIRAGCVTISKEKSIDGQQRTIGQYIPDFALTGKPWNAKTGFGGANAKLVLSNGSVVDFLSDFQRPQSFEEFSWHLVWIDEAVDEWVKDRIVARLVDASGKVALTAVGEKAWLNRLARLHRLRPDSVEVAPPGFVISVTGTSMRDNELLSQDEIHQAEILYGRGSREARMRIEGEDVLAEGVVLDRFDPLVNIYRGPRVLPKWTRYEFIDPGYGNAFAVAFVAIDETGRWRTYDEIYVRKTLSEEVAVMILAKRAEYGYDEPYLPAVIDPAGDQKRFRGIPLPSYREILAGGGVRTIPGGAGPGSVDVGNALLNGMLSRGEWLIHEACVWTRFELENYKLGDPDPHTGEYKNDDDKPIDAHNHLIAAHRYGMTKRPAFIPAEEYHGVPGSAAADAREEELAEARSRRKPWR